jgi:hypothetical protein
MVECNRGERPNLTSSVTHCEAYGADHKSVVQEWLRVAPRLEEGKIYPWRYAGHNEGTEVPI